MQSYQVLSSTNVSLQVQNFKISNSFSVKDEDDESDARNGFIARLKSLNKSFRRFFIGVFNFCQFAYQLKIYKYCLQ